MISIYAPKSLRSDGAEKSVTQRLKRHFRHIFLQKKKDLKRIRVRGAIFVGIGISSLSFLTLATYFGFLGELAIQICGIILMPLGWFGFWEGLSKLVDTSPAVIQEERLFEKLSKATYQFQYIEEEPDKRSRQPPAKIINKGDLRGHVA